MENLYYTPMSIQRSELRKKWNGTGTDWQEFLTDCESDLFQHPELLPQDVQTALSEFEEQGDLYEQCRSLLEKLEPLGFTFEYGLDGIPYELKLLKK